MHLSIRVAAMVLSFLVVSSVGHATPEQPSDPAETGRAQVLAGLRAPVPVIRTSTQPFGTAPFTPFLDGTASFAPDSGIWIAGFRWDFGDGTVSTAGWVNHTFTTPGIYQVMLTVTDSAGQIASTNLTMQVSCDPNRFCAQSPLTTRWVRQLFSTPGDDALVDVASGPDGGIVAISNLASAVSPRVIISKFNPSGVDAWDLIFFATGPGGSPPSVRLTAVAVTRFNEVWVGGHVTGTLHAGAFVLADTDFLLQLGSGGQVLHAVPNVGAVGLASNSVGEVFAVSEDLITRVTSAGMVVSQRLLPFTLSSIAVDSADNLLVGGVNPSPSPQGVVAKLTPGGTLLWTKPVGTLPGNQVLRVRIAVDDTFVATGTFAGGFTWAGRSVTASGGATFIVSGGADGSERWLQELRTGSGALAVDSSGLEIWVAAQNQIQEFGARDGTALFSTSVGSPYPQAPFAVRIKGMAAHPAGLGVGGDFTGTQDFGAGLFTGRGVDLFAVDLRR